MCNLNAYAPSAIMTMLKNTLRPKQVIFLDGIDESNAFVANKNFTKEITDWLFENDIRFVISTRADHFDGTDALLERYLSATTIRHRSGVALIEMKGFAIKQFVKAAMMLKRLQKKDSRNFNKRYPIEKPAKENRRNLATAFLTNPIFQAPIFSRYAFVLLDETKTLAEAVGKIIRWECHDYLRTGNLEELQATYSFFEETIKNYLENVAFEMKTEETLDPTTYKHLVSRFISTPVSAFIESGKISDAKLKRECLDMVLNASLCLLSKSEKGEKVSFEHPLFKEHFIAKRLANTTLREDNTCLEMYYLLSKSKAFIDAYVTQLISNGKFDVVKKCINPRRKYANPDEHRKAFIDDMFACLADAKGVELLPGATLTPLAELFPNIQINISSAKKITSVWCEIDALREEGLPVAPAAPFVNARELALSFCENNSVIPNEEIDRIQAAYKIHEELFEESDSDTLNYIGLICARIFMRISYHDVEEKAYSLMSGRMAEHYIGLECLTFRYFCDWFSELLTRRSEYENSTNWALHGIREIEDVPTPYSLRISAYKRIIQNSARESQWEQFEIYYNRCLEMGVNLDFNMTQYRVVQLLKKRETQEAFDLLQEYEAVAGENYYFLWLKGTCLNRLGVAEGLADIVLKIEQLAKIANTPVQKARLDHMAMDILISHLLLTKDTEQLLEVAKNAITVYATWKQDNSSINDMQRIIDEIESGRFGEETSFDPGLWI